ncbi:MAG: 1-(5-phosphoribosyl)-5-[(5-phosphoribosylamino)methylideneamino]imidazole-4-carboxamide isomerase [Pirellulaceae bacterium]|nr:1-(5-phosphoribosyl)-5-[(5-phosphoribosylamino)methylideneamino]imidazole-4-carboxamide isomerase [Pirellulaceae bacterium]
MEIWPAIDLYNGQCVRLQQGDYDRDTVFSDDPGAMAKRWFDEGASFLHCVDLDGARSGSIVNESAIRNIVAAAGGQPVQLGGGVRTEETIERLLSLGLSRLVVGTAALKEPAWFGKMCQRYSGHMVLGLDARNGMVATEGWLETSTTRAVDLVKRIADQTSDCVAVVYTDIARDGMMSGPNFEQLIAMKEASPFPVIASGGVTTLADIDQLVKNQTHAAILGRTLYEGHIQLRDALSHANTPASNE